MFEPVLTRNFHHPNSEKLTTYLASGGYQALKLALAKSPDEIIEMIKRSGLRGRGGAGFPAGAKWDYMPKDRKVQKIIAINADEGEPGTFKDRAIIEHDPHQIIEGVIIAAYAVWATKAYVYIRGELDLGYTRWNEAVAEAYQHGFLGKNILGTDLELNISVHQGAGAYICGEETAMLESLEGKVGNPRIKPPYPAQIGLFGLPTLVQNVETLACIPHIIERGPEWFAGIGTAESKGPKIFSVSGHVTRPGNYELPLGTPLREIIYDHAGGIRNGRQLKAVIPGGASTSMLPADKVDTPMAFETLKQAGSELGTGAIIVMDETTCMVETARRLAKFYAHESCGQCGPCRIGSHRLYEILDRMEHGIGQPGDVETALEIANGLDGLTFCPMGNALVNPARSAINLFRDEFEYHITHKQCSPGNA